MPFPVHRRRPSGHRRPLRLPARAGRAGLAGIVLSALMVGPGARPAGAQLSNDVRSDADWIMSAQLPDGALANYVDRKAVWPYLANFAAMGLARAKEVTNDARYTEAAWRWLGWYQDHMDAQGFVTDYVVNNGVPVSNGFMDSTDAYAGTFLIALKATYRATGDRARLDRFRRGIDGAVRAIEATQEPDGLTWAKPDWRAKYLMDQAETYAGLVAAGELAQALGEQTLAQRAKADAFRMRTGVEKLWNSKDGAYDWAVHEDGARTRTNWSYLYSDALQQPWAIAFGLVPDASRASALASRFNTKQPNWAHPARTAQFSGGSSATVGYWPMAALAYSVVRSSVAGAATTSIRSASLTAKRAWPFTTGNAGQLILLEAYTGSSSILAPLPTALANPLPATPTTTTTRAPAATTSTTRTTLPAPTTTTTKLPVTTTVPVTAVKL